MLEEAEEICRVCRSESTPTHPLYYPCKCSGSIRFVHEDCLLEWLSHSKKKYCELCEHPYKFSPIYRSDMPEQVPLYVLCSQLMLRMITFLKTCFRFLCVASVWLVILPNFTLRIWRFYFWSAENIGFRINEGHENSNNELTLKGLFYECLEGQIITAFVVIIFVAAYLFREWMMQNMPDMDDQQEEQEFTDIRNQPEDQLDQEQLALDTLVNAFEVLDQQTDDDNDDNFRNQLQNLMIDIDNERQQRERPHSSSFHPTKRLNRDEIDEDLLFGGLDGTGTSMQDDNDKYIDKYNNRHYEDDHIINSLNQQPSWNQQDDEDLIVQNDSRKKRKNVKLLESDTSMFDAGCTDFSGDDLQQLNHPRLPQPPPLEPPVNHPQQQEIPAVIDNNEEQNGNNDDAAVDDDDDEPFDAADDINGILEAIGMRGNPWMLVQNSVLMALMISLCLGISIWMPYVLGRFVVMLRPASLIETPIYIMRLVIDPLVDFVLDQCIPQMWSVFGEPLESILPKSVKSTLFEAQEKLFQTFHNATLPSNKIIPGKSLSNSLPESPISLTKISSLTSLLPPYFIFDWGNFEQKMEVWSTLLLTRWHQFASGKTGLDRSVCIIVGYAIIFCLGSWYLAQMKKKQYTSDLFFQDFIRQQGIFLKVLFFFSIEMVIFPIACGFLLDMATLPLFSNASFQSRLDFQLKNPYSSLFLHWFLGTGVLFYFANFITVCREIIRPGVLWYIRDPNDPQFHPVQEMVDKPFMTLLQKIGYSALAYAVMIVFGVGTVTYTLALTNVIFPLRLSFSNPLCSTVAIDFLAVQFLLPPLIMLVKPREYSKKALDWWWHFTSRQLRLTSYMFNKRMPDEEGHQSYFTNSPVISQPDGMFVRVPKHDSVIVDPTRRMLVPVDPVHFQPIDEEERKRKHPAAVDTNDENQSTIVVYIPSYFYQRVTIFLVLLWLSISIFVCSVTVIPLLFGRFLFFHYFAPNTKVNDLYSFSLGLYIIVVFIFTLFKCYRFNGSWLFSISSIMKKVTKVLYLVSTLGLIMPLVFGIAVDLFVLMPIRSSEHKGGLVINLSQDWSFGVAYISIIYNIIHVLPTPNRLQRHLNEITSNGIMQINTWDFTLTIAAPVIFGSLIAIAIPGIISWGVLQFLDSTSFSGSDRSMQLSVIRYTYPIAFCVFMIFLVAFVIKKLLDMWMQTVRDDTYLIGKRLHNINHSQGIVI